MWLRQEVSISDNSGTLQANYLIYGNTPIYSLFDRATADGHTYDGEGVSSFDSHFANISDRHDIGTLINIT